MIEAKDRKKEIEEAAKVYDESTALSWFWALIFGPLYFAVHRFWGYAALIFVLNFFFIGFILAPFLAYPAWKARAVETAWKDNK